MKVTTASDAWMSIFERCFLNPGFWKRGQRRSVLNSESADMPENIVVTWSLRFPRYATATGTPRKPFSVWTILLCIAVYRPYTCVCGVHMLNMYTPENSQVPRERPSLLYDHTNVILRVVVCKTGSTVQPP